MRRQRVIALVGITAVLLACLLAWRGLSLQRARQHAPGTPTPQAARELAAQLEQLEWRENEIARRFWAPELEAERHGQVLDSLWDAVNASTGMDKWTILESVHFEKLILAGYPPDPQVLPYGVSVHAVGRKGAEWPANRWRAAIQAWRTEGWRLEQVELRHHKFTPSQGGQPARSGCYLSAHLVRSEPAMRAAIRGDIELDWTQDATGPPAVRTVDATGLEIVTRSGEPMFRQVLFEEIRPPARSHFIDPLILHDLDGDGIPEVILGARNLVYRYQGTNGFASSPLLAHSSGLIFTGVVADFDGDGWDDFLCARFEGLLLFKGSKTGTFDEPGRLVWRATPHLRYGQVLTCGDVDGDGDLDLWLGQYKNPYERGQMPTPYYDANDGNPSYLLLNDGKGALRDATEAAGLGKKRWRRAYAGSLVDLDGDRDLDLLVVSDFAGIDLHANNGHGQFEDRTRQWVSESHLFGMAHTIADFNVDGYSDILVMGMHCPTAHRLDSMGLMRSERPGYDSMRAPMTQGNRFYLGRPGGVFREGEAGGSIARSGWSWGCSAADFDNDGCPDVYIANGHETRQSVTDYEREFWLHDIYVGDSGDDLVKSAYFAGKFTRTRGHGQSYGGYEKNRLFWNQAGKRFLDIGFLAGVALEQDSRNVVADDIDGDGRVDLVVTTFEAWPQARQTVRVFQNQIESGHNWIGLRFKPRARGCSPIGALCTIGYEGKVTTRPIVTGDSHRAQQAWKVHFGLGMAKRVESLTVQWANGERIELTQPQINHYHDIYAPRKGVEP